MQGKGLEKEGKTMELDYTEILDTYRIMLNTQWEQILELRARVYKLEKELQKHING